MKLMRYESARYICRSLLKAAATLLVLASMLCATSLNFVEELPLKVSWENMRVPKWSHGALLTVQYHDTISPLIWVLDSLGSHVVPFTISGARWMHVYDWDCGLNGTLGISGSVADSDGRAATFVAWISADGSSSQVIRTSSYRPAMVAVAPDGTLWTVGAEFATNPSGGVSPTLVANAGVIRHFDRSGKTLAAFVPQSTIQKSVSLAQSRNTLRVSQDRIAWYSEEGRYVEISLAGSLLTDIPLALPSGQSMNTNTGFALTDAGDAFLSAQPPTLRNGGRPAEPLQIYILDRSARVWKPVLQPSSGAAAQSAFGYIYGVDGNKLVVRGANLIKFFTIGD
jgi:hypothetical protein